MDASERTCPKCGWAREPGAIECPACGIVFARYGGGPRPAVPAEAASLAPPPLPPSAALNPYAPPQSHLQSTVEPVPGQMFSLFNGGSIWRSGDLLVMQKGASLPSRCLACNQPAAVHFPKKMYWHHPGLYFLAISPFIYLIVALIVRKRADLVLPLCAEHAEKRKRSTTIGSLLLLLGFVAMLGSCTQIEGDGAAFGLIWLAGFALVIAGAAVSNAGGNPVVPKKIDDYYVWLRKVSASYLSALPPAPPGL